MNPGGAGRGGLPGMPAVSDHEDPSTTGRTACLWWAFRRRSTRRQSRMTRGACRGVPAAADVGRWGDDGWSPSPGIVSDAPPRERPCSSREPLRLADRRSRCHSLSRSPRLRRADGSARSRASRRRAPPDPELANRRSNAHAAPTAPAPAAGAGASPMETMPTGRPAPVDAELTDRDPASSAIQRRRSESASTPASQGTCSSHAIAARSNEAARVAGSLAHSKKPGCIVRPRRPEPIRPRGAPASSGRGTWATMRSLAGRARDAPRGMRAGPPRPAAGDHRGRPGDRPRRGSGGRPRRRRSRAGPCEPGRRQ